MKKKLLICAIFCSFLGVAQTRYYTLQQAETTTDYRVVEAFVKANPNHPKTPMLRQRILALMANQGAAVGAVTSQTQKNTTDQAQSAEKGRKTADKLTRMFNGQNSKDVYLTIKNMSNCPLVVRVAGQKTYTMEVAAQNSNLILVPKGKYTISTSLCGANYQSVKTLTENKEITLRSQ